MREAKRRGRASGFFHLDAKKALRAFWTQRAKAKQRGIGWELTFKQWCDFWGEDIDNRGPGRFQLGMQRFKDEGPYALGNIRKGHPKDNTKTWVAMRQNRDQEAKRKQWLASEGARLAVPPDVMSEDEQELAKLGYKTLWGDERLEAFNN